MEYIYSAMILHSAGKQVDEQGVKNILEAAGITANDNRVKTVVASLQDVNIEESIARSAIAVPVVSTEEVKHSKKEKQKEPEVSDDDMQSGLESLFG